MNKPSHAELLAEALAEHGVDSVEQMLGVVPVYEAPATGKSLRRKSETPPPPPPPDARKDPKQLALDSMNDEGSVARRKLQQVEKKIELGIATKEDREWYEKHQQGQGADQDSTDAGVLTNANQATRRVRVEHEKPLAHQVAHVPGFVSAQQEREAVNTPAAPYATTPQSHVEHAYTRKREFDSRWQEIVAADWPSNLQWHPDAALLARRFSVTDFLTISDWAETNDHAYLLQALDATLSIPVYDLPIADGVFFLYWHRMRSYPKSPRTLDWKCETVSEEFPGCGYENHTELKRQNLAVQSLKDIGFSYANLDPRTDLPRMALYSEWLEFENCRAIYANYLTRKLQWEAQVYYLEHGLIEEVTLEQPKPPKLKFAANQLSLYQAAFWVREGKTLEDKKEILLQEGDGELMQLCLNLSRNVHYGVLELAAVDCVKCNAQRQFRLTMEPASFVP